MSRIDYSKWDKFQDSDEDEEGGEDEDYGSYPRAPQVTKLEVPSSVTFGGGGGEVRCVQENKRPAVVPGPAQSSPPAPKPSLPAVNATLNGGEAPGYLWSQTREEVVVRVWVPPGTRAKDLQVDLRQVGKSMDIKWKLEIVGKDGSVILDEVLANAVKIVDEEAGLDWELEDVPDDPQGRRCVKVSLMKGVPQPGLVHWWSQVFQGGPAIDTTKIEGRKGNFQAAWEEAQEMFRKSVAGREPMVVDIGEGTGEEGQEGGEDGEEQGE